MHIRLHTSEQGRKNQNQAAEHRKKVPKRLLDFGLVYESELLSIMSRGRDRRTGYKEDTSDTADIIEWLDF